MKPEVKITKLEVTTFEYEVRDIGKDYNTFNNVWEPGAVAKQRGNILTMHTDQGIVGEYPTGGPPLAEVRVAAEYLIGKNALEREKIYNDTKRGLRHFAMLGVGVIDILLWDIAGKLYDEPIYRLLGGTKKPLPAYASTLHGDEVGGLGTPEQYADFAQQCMEMGYTAFKAHGWGLAGSNIKREIDNVLLLGKRFENKLALRRPPPIDGGLPGARARGDAFHRQASVADLLEQLFGRAQDRALCCRISRATALRLPPIT